MFIPLTNTRFWPLLASLACMLAVPSLAGGEEQPAPYPSPPVSYWENGRERQVDFGAHKLTVLHFWATWCPPCVPELSDVEATAQTYGDRGLQVIAISMDNDPAKAAALFAEKKFSRLSLFFDRNTAAYRAVRAKGLPTTLFIDQKGNIIHHASGPVAWKDQSTTGFIEKRLR